MTLKSRVQKIEDRCGNEHRLFLPKLYDVEGKKCEEAEAYERAVSITLSCGHAKITAERQEEETLSELHDRAAEEVHRTYAKALVLPYYVDLL